MSSDGERLPKPSKRRRLVVSDSESSDESIITTHHKRRVHHRVVSDAESSDEDSDIPRPVNKRKNHKLLSENESSYGSSESDTNDLNFIESDSSSDWQSDWESTDELEEETSVAVVDSPSPKAKGKKSKKHSEENPSASTSAAGFDSDVSDGQSEKCPICLLPFRTQEVATPAPCEHCFCLECILEWSKNINTCPVDRQTFTVVHVRSKLGGKITRNIPIAMKEQLEEIIQEDPTYCEICHECDREDRMLLCDGCDLGYHLECLIPPMTEVPMDEWFCPDCSQNSQYDAEVISWPQVSLNILSSSVSTNRDIFRSRVRENIREMINMVDIDLDEIPDLMEEARNLGLSYRRSRTGHLQNMYSPRIIPRTRQTERVRALIRAGRELNRSRDIREHVIRDRIVCEYRGGYLDQPSTSSGIESIGENSRSRSPDVNAPSTSTGTTTTCRRVTTKRKLQKRKSQKRKPSKKRKNKILREVRITEINNDGEEEEIVTYVKVAAKSTHKKKKMRRRKKRKSKRARTVLSVASANKTLKRRLANALKMNNPIRGVPLLVPTMKNIMPIPDRSQLINSRYSAGITQVSLFGNNLSLDYSPPGSDDEFDSTVGHGPAIIARSRGPISTNRRRMALKGIVNPTPRIEQTSSANLLDTIISNQELWHSKKSSEVTLKANGTLVLANKDSENGHNINNNDSPVKKKAESDAQDQLPSNDQPLDLSNINPNDITQAPMYNSSRGGGNRGNFRGSYRDNNRQSYGGQGYGGRDSFSGGGGRRSFGGSGARGDFGNRDFGPPANYSMNFEHRAPASFGIPHLRNRNPHQFRNERNRYSLPERPPFREGSERPHFPFPENFQRGPPPGIPPLIPSGSLRMPIVPNNQPVNQEELPGGIPGPQSQGNFESQLSEPSTAKPDEECDIYGDIEGPNKHAEGESKNENINNSSTLLPPPEPPSGLLDFEENSKSEKDNDSDQELIIDDAPKDDTAKIGKTDDKYDPFNAEESDSNESTSGKENAVKIPPPIEPPPLEPPPSLANFSGLNILNTDDDFQEPIKPTIRLTAYDDDDDEDSQADCPNFSIYSSETMDVARNSEQELSSQIGPLEPPPLPPEIPDMPEDDDVIVGDIQACDLSDIPEPSTPYVEALQKERQTISKIPSKKISANDSRGKITFKINKFKLNNKFGNLYDEIDKDVENSFDQEKDHEEKKETKENENIDAEEKNDSNDATDSVVVAKSSKSHKEKGKRAKRKVRRNSEDNSDSECAAEHPMDELPTQKLQSEDSTSQDFDNSELPTQQLDISEKSTQEFDISELATQRLDSLDSRAENRDISDLPTQRLDLEPDSSELLTQKLDESDLPTQKLDISELDTQKEDILVLPTQKLNASESQRNEPDISELQTQRLYSPDAGVPTLYSPDVPIPTLYSPEPEKTEDDGGQTPNVGRKRDSSKSEEEEIKISEQHEARSLGDETEEDIGDKENVESANRADRSPETVISIADTTQSSQNDDCEIVENRVDEDVTSSSYIERNKRLHMQTGEGQSDIFRQERVDGEEDFPLEKEGHSSHREVPSQEPWDSDGGYTPCKDELPLKERRKRTVSPFDESGLEPITPTKDKNDDLDRCRTPAAYAGLGTEAISETDEAMNFEDELTLLSLRKEKEMEEGEILEDGRLIRRGKSKDKDDDSKKKKKKDKKDKSKESEKNKENISSENLVSWKKVSKSTKDRNYREKDRRSRSREKDKDKKKKKEALKKKEKRKELPRYDVRKIVAEKPRPRKDEYGRDIRDLSRSLTRSKSRSRSISKSRRSVSKARRSRSYSRVRSRTRSRSKRRSWSREIQRERASRGRSYSRGRSLSPRRRKTSRRRSASRKRRSRSLSRRRRSISPRRRKRSHSRKRRSRTRTRSRDRRKDKKKHKSRSRSRNRKRSRSKSAKRAASRSREKKHIKRKQMSRSRSLERSLSQERDRNRNWEVPEKVISRDQHFREREGRESWSAQWTPSLSASRSKTPERGNELPTRGWSPVHRIDNVTVPPKNLTVILTNKEAIKKKKKEKKKERRKSKDEDKRKKTKRTRTPPPSKEVFASGDNILVSVCFNKDNEVNQMQAPELPETIPLMPPTKRRRREPLQLEPPKKMKKDKAKEKRAKSPKAKKDKKKKSKAAEIAATKKPVAVIDLDQSPFREQTPSPRDIIVLSDDDEKQAQNLIAMEPRQSSQTTPSRDQFVSQGPKTPPEPQVKFSINNKVSNLRPSMMNPLMEEEEEEEIDERVEEELEMRAQEELELRLKIGPNTPPEPPSSPPTSPDAYDPFDPTKSRSPTPVQSQEATPLNDERNQRTSPRKHEATDAPLTVIENQQQEQQASDKQAEKPKIISMVTLKRASPKRDTSPANDSQTDVAIVSESPTKSQQNQQNAQSTAAPFPTVNPVLATVAAAVQRNIFNANAPATTQRNLLQANRISPSTQIKQRPLERPQLPNLFANSVKTMPLRTSKPTAKSNTLGQNGNDTEMINDVIDMSSPYSPGSTLSDGMFEPPSPYNTPPPVNNKSKGNKDVKKDAFDTLFGSSPVANRTSAKAKVKKDKRKKRVYPVSSATNPKVGVRMDENQLQILDDLPSSAVELQVKDKFLKKLNRQERVVEEVKLVLKPHYTKKHVTKEEYKDIMRKAVPKICHNRSGEINLKKIRALIEAYVKKCRTNKKKMPTSASSKVVKPVKNLWS